MRGRGLPTRRGPAPPPPPLPRPNRRRLSSPLRPRAKPETPPGRDLTCGPRESEFHRRSSATRPSVLGPQSGPVETQAAALPIGARLRGGASGTGKWAVRYWGRGATCFLPPCRAAWKVRLRHRRHFAAGSLRPPAWLAFGRRSPFTPPRRSWGPSVLARPPPLLWLSACLS